MGSSVVPRKTFAHIFAQPELNRHVGSFLGDLREGLLDQARWCMAAKPLSGHHRVRLWCLGCLWRWLRHPWNQLRGRVPSRGIAAAEFPFIVSPNPGDDFPHGW